jgi:hypothetical protein
MNPRAEYIAYLLGRERAQQQFDWINEILVEIETQAKCPAHPDALRYLVLRFGLLLGYLKEEEMLRKFAPDRFDSFCQGSFPELKVEIHEVHTRATDAMQKILKKRGFVALSGPDKVPADVDVGDMADLFAGRRDA